MSGITYDFALGDTAYGCSTARLPETRTCDVCEGRGRVAIKGHQDLLVRCPGKGCHLGYVDGDYRTEFRVVRLTIGQVECRRVRPDLHEKDPVSKFDVDRYMADETGVGSGRIWYGHELRTTASDARQWALDQGWIENPTLDTGILRSGVTA